MLGGMEQQYVDDVIAFATINAATKAGIKDAAIQKVSDLQAEIEHKDARLHGVLMDFAAAYQKCFDFQKQLEASDAPTAEDRQRAIELIQRRDAARTAFIKQL